MAVAPRPHPPLTGPSGRRLRLPLGDQTTGHRLARDAAFLVECTIRGHRVTVRTRIRIASVGERTGVFADRAAAGCAVHGISPMPAHEQTSMHAFGHTWRRQTRAAGDSPAALVCTARCVSGYGVGEPAGSDIGVGVGVAVAAPDCTRKSTSTHSKRLPSLSRPRARKT